MRYYSDKLNKLFDSEESLQEAEKQQEEKEAEKQQLAETKKVRAAEVEDAYKKTLEAREEANKIIRDADKVYYDLRDKFVKDFGSYHMTYTDDNGNRSLQVSDLVDSVFDAFKNFPFIF